MTHPIRSAERATLQKRWPHNAESNRERRTKIGRRAQAQDAQADTPSRSPPDCDVGDVASLSYVKTLTTSCIDTPDVIESSVKYLGSAERHVRALPQSALRFEDCPTSHASSRRGRDRAAELSPARIATLPATIPSPRSSSTGRSHCDRSDTIRLNQTFAFRPKIVLKSATRIATPWGEVIQRNLANVQETSAHVSIVARSKQMVE